VGDSLTAGLEASDRTWPKRLVQTAGIRLHDASQQGATVASAKNQLEQLPHDADVLVLLIGGNDILERRSPEAFAVALDQLLTAAKAQCRTVVMQAIPLPPLANRYGALQRELARKHRVRLIPARRLMAVLTTRGATVDGIHLTDRGQELMARLMTTALGLTTIPPAEPAPSPAERSTNADSP
jgi:lysophospholipase L1-like esterase